MLNKPRPTGMDMTASPGTQRQTECTQWTRMPYRRTWTREKHKKNASHPLGKKREASGGAEQAKKNGNKIATQSTREIKWKNNKTIYEMKSYEIRTWKTRHKCLSCASVCVCAGRIASESQQAYAHEHKCHKIAFASYTRGFLEQKTKAERRCRRRWLVRISEVLTRKCATSVRVRLFLPLSFQLIVNRTKGKKSRRNTYVI